MNLNPIISYKESGYKDKAKQNPKRKLPVVRNKEEKKRKMMSIKFDSIPTGNLT